MATTRHAPGTPSWIDLGTRDIEATVGFYGAVFGWTFLSLGARAGGYGFFQLNGRTVAAAGPLVRENDVPAWTVYFGVTDADATAGSVERAGGVVRFSPMDVFDNGRMAGFTDPQGAAFAIWQPRKVQGLDVVGCPGALLWVELHTSDPAAARAFYGSLFGWRYHETPVENFTYTRVSPTGDEKDAFGGITRVESDAPRPYWLPYFQVTDADAAVTAAERAGGSVIMPVEEVKGVGRMAMLADPQGARFSVMTPAW